MRVPLVSTVLTVLIGGSLVLQTPMLVIAHRGASGYRPEHTVEGYKLAIDMGAGAIEPDLVITSDGVLIARHENEIGETTDVAEKFPGRRTTRTVDGKPVSGWFAEDFTMAEIRRLRARERLRFRSHDYDGRFPIPTFDDVLDLVDAVRRETGKVIVVYPETKHPAYFRQLGLPLEDRVLERLRAHGLTERDSPVFVQSFDPSSLQYLRSRTRVRLVQLTERPSDVTPERLAAIAKYADGLGAEKRLILPEAPDRRLLPPTTVIADARRAGLFVHVWTMRSEPDYLSPSYDGDATAEIRRFVELGVDGLFTDFPDTAVAALNRAPPRAR